MDTVFVAMPFGNTVTAEAYKRRFLSIRASCLNEGVRQVIRVDNAISDSSSIMPRIRDEIENADAVIVDLSEERPNVYYELGIAEGAGKTESDILLVAQANTTLHHDIAHRRVAIFSDNADLGRYVKNFIRGFREDVMTM
jgi:nucleoside 2-deoxyribosyltransferase